MKFIVLLALCVSAAYAVPVAPVLAAPAALVNTGASAQFRSQDNLGNYAFGYNEDHATGGTFRRESGSPGVAVGSYGLRDIDGRVRVVNYVADGLGFRANIQTNEPGVEPKDPAATLINKAAVAVAPAVAPAPLIAAPAIAAPVAHAAPLVAPAHAHYAAPIAHAHAHAAPIVHAGPAAISSYSVATSHGIAAPLAAPYAAPYAAPLAYPAGVKIY